MEMLRLLEANATSGEQDSSRLSSSNVDRIYRAAQPQAASPSCTHNFAAKAKECVASDMDRAEGERGRREPAKAIPAQTATFNLAANDYDVRSKSNLRLLSPAHKGENKLHRIVTVPSTPTVG
jgi:hypothetical protein